MLMVNKTLTTLDLVNTGILDEGCCSIFMSLQHNSALRNLYLDGNGLTEKSIGYMDVHFSNCVYGKKKGLERLWIGMNRFGDKIVDLLHTLKNYHHILTLGLSSIGMTHRSSETLYTSFKNHPSLQVLNIGCYKSTLALGEIPNSIGDEGVEHLHKLLLENQTLKSIDVCENSFSDDGMDHLTKSLRQNRSLLFFSYSQLNHKYPKFIHGRIQGFLESNLQTSGVDRAKINLKNFHRELVHGSHINFIDSEYRNKM